MKSFLAQSSPYTFVWHDNCGQSFPDNSDVLRIKVQNDGLVIDITPNAIINEPLIFINSAANGNKSQNTINIGASAKVQIIQYLMSDDQTSTNYVHTDINCLDSANIDHCIIQQGASHLSILQEISTKISQGENSHVNTNLFSFGGGTNKINLQILLERQNASCSTSSLAFTKDSQIQEVKLRIDHINGQCKSDTIARAVVHDKSHTDFSGKIMVHPHATKTSADLQIKSLLCSPKAFAINKPELEIYNDDVRCSHGATTGELDNDALFYMRTRGIDEESAKAILVDSFIQPTIDSCQIPNIATYIKEVIRGERIGY